MTSTTAVTQVAISHAVRRMRHRQWSSMLHLYIALPVSAQRYDNSCPSCLYTFSSCLAADPFSAPEQEIGGGNDTFVAKAATITVAIVGVGGSAVAGTAYALYKEVKQYLLHTHDTSVLLLLLLLVFA